MKKKKSIIIAVIICLLVLVGVIILFITKQFKKYEYYVDVSNGVEPSTFYELRIDKKGNYNMKGVFTSAVGPDENYSKEYKYNGKFTKEVMDKIDLVSKKIGTTKEEYVLYFEDFAENQDDSFDEKLYSSRLLVESVKKYDNGEINASICILNKIVNQDVSSGNNYYNILNNECNN